MQLLNLPKFFFFLASFLIFAVSDHPETWCLESSNTYSNNTSYSRNLKDLLSSLPSNALTSVFNFSSSGEGSDTVYGQYLCFHGVSGERCSECLAHAAKDMEAFCPNRNEAVAWMNMCHLHYSNNNFFGTLNVREVSGFSNAVPIKEYDRARYYNLVDVLGNLSRIAAFNPLANMSAAGRASPSGPYAVVHCTRDLSPQQCNTFLHKAVKKIMACCFDFIGSKVMGRSCYLRY